MEVQLSPLFTSRLKFLSSCRGHAFAQSLTGIERETLRIDKTGMLSTAPHPAGLGAALTHPKITTDYSEALLEFISSPENQDEAALAQLDAIHRFAYSELDDEILWSQSMPCELPGEDNIPIAWYGTSHAAMFKHVYRRGLALRYGRTMQCIAGVHYNFSVAEELWRLVQAHDRNTASAADFRSESYIALIRNFQRYGWLLMYLFGASPAVSTNFLRGRPHGLQALSDDTLYLPHATSLRMSDLGYRNTTQGAIAPSYNALGEYIASLSRAVCQPHPEYEKFGTQRNGEWIQLSTNLLQIEDEYYAPVRPKCPPGPDEYPLDALRARGVQYVEVRCLDIDPYDPLGINLEAMRFIKAFLHFCALEASPAMDGTESRECAENFSRTVTEGRRPGLTLRRNGSDVALRAWGLELLAGIEAAAEMLDAGGGQGVYRKAVTTEREKLLLPDSTPSARVLSSLHDGNRSFFEFGLQQSHAHADQFCARPLDAREKETFNRLSQASLAELKQREQTQVGSFSEFMMRHQERCRQPQ